MIDPKPIDTIIGLSGVNRAFVKDISFVPHLGIVFAFISKNASSLLENLSISDSMGLFLTLPPQEST